MEYWNSDITEESWKTLIALRSKVNFILIGGWASYIYTKLMKSRDIDIVVDYGELERINSLFGIVKNDRLKKYETKIGRVDVDIYVPYYSMLPIPPQDLIKKFRTNVEGFDTVTPESLLVLKLGAFEDRRESVKGYKDSVDALGLLLFSGLNIQTFKEILREYGLERYTKYVVSLFNSADERMLKYLHLNQNSFSRLKRKIVKDLTDS